MTQEFYGQCWVSGDFRNDSRMFGFRKYITYAPFLIWLLKMESNSRKMKEDRNLKGVDIVIQRDKWGRVKSIKTEVSLTVPIQLQALNINTKTHIKTGIGWNSIILNIEGKCIVLTGFWSDTRR